MRAAERYNLLRCAMSFVWLVTALITEQNAVSRSTCQYHYAGRAPRGSARLTIGIFKRIRAGIFFPFFVPGPGGLTTLASRL